MTPPPSIQQVTEELWAGMSVQVNQDNLNQNTSGQENNDWPNTKKDSTSRKCSSRPSSMLLWNAIFGCGWSWLQECTINNRLPSHMLAILCPTSSGQTDITLTTPSVCLYVHYHTWLCESTTIPGCDSNMLTTWECPFSELTWRGVSCIIEYKENRT